MKYFSASARNRHLVRNGLLALLLWGNLLITGCDNKGNSPPVKQTIAPEQAQAKTKSQGGGVDDMNVYPAPPGQKTGLEGGKK